MEEQISIDTLPNGLVVIVEDLPEVQSAAYDLLVPGGIVTDPEDRIGASILLQELMTRGAGPFDSIALSNAFDDLGIVHSEAAGHDRFALRGSLLAEHLSEALRLVSTIVKEPHLPGDEIESINSILIQDIESLVDNPSRRSIVELTERYYPAPFGRPTMGTIDGLQRSTEELLREDWRRRFRPRGSVLSIAGKVTRAEALAMADRWFGDWEGEAEPLPRFVQPTPRGAHHIDFDSAQLQIALAYPSARFGDESYYAAKVMNGILSGGMFGRLFIEAREKRGLCYSVFSRHSASKEHGTMLVYAGTTPERAQETLDVVLGELRRLGGSVTEEELSRAKANLKASLVIGEESSGSRCASNASDWWVHRAVRSGAEIEASINAVDARAVDRCLERFPSDSYMSLTLGPKALIHEASD